MSPQVVSSLPGGWSESSLFEDDLHGLACPVQRVVHDGVAPPYRCSLVGQLERQEDDDGADGETSVQTSGCEVVVVGPPAAVLVLDDLVEDETDDAPGRVVDGRCRGNHTGTAEDEGNIDVTEVGLWEHAGKYVEHGRGEGAGDEEVHESIVDLASTEDALRTNQTPNDRSVEEDPSAWASVVVLLF